jgi:hypothetical protein
MDIYAALFWIGFILSLILHANDTHHAMYALAATTCMFVGSKIGREFLGIR